MEDPDPASVKVVRIPVSGKVSMHCAQYALDEGLIAEAAFKLAERIAATEHIGNAFAKRDMRCSPPESLGYINCCKPIILFI